MNRVPTWIIILFQTFILFLQSLFRPTVFVQITKGICQNWGWDGPSADMNYDPFRDLYSFLAEPHFPPWPAVFVQNTKCIFMKCRIYLSKVQNVFVQIVGEMNWILTWIIILFQIFILVLHSPLRPSVFFQIAKQFVQTDNCISPYCKTICSNSKIYLSKLQSYLSKLQNVFAQIKEEEKLSKLHILFVQIAECICPNCKMYLSKLGGDEPVRIVILFFFRPLFFSHSLPRPAVPSGIHLGREDSTVLWKGRRQAQNSD